MLVSGPVESYRDQSMDMLIVKIIEVIQIKTIQGNMCFYVLELAIECFDTIEL